MEKALFKGDYFTFWDDGRFGCSDGVGYLGEVSANEARSLYEAMQKYYSPADAARTQRVEALAKKWREPIEQGYIGDETRLLANCADELEKALK